MNPDYRLYTCNELRYAEQAAQQHSLPHALMYFAGQAAAQLALSLRKNQSTPVLVLAGPGNNGGDACYTAAQLAQHGVAVEVLLCADPARYSGDAATAWEHLQTVKVSISRYDQQLPIEKPYSLIIDGLFGIGLNRPFSPPLRDLIGHLNQLSDRHAIPLLALDLPSGINADSGEFTDPQQVAIKATHTISFLGLKAGLFTGAGKAYSGQISHDSLGAEPDWFTAATDSEIGPPWQMALNQPGSTSLRLPPRELNSHKGSFGHVCIAGGSRGMTGAALLAGRTALFSGAGKVSIAFTGDGPEVDPMHPEIMCRSIRDYDISGQILVTGPGLGTDDAALGWLDKLLQQPGSQVFDADALNLIAAHSGLAEQLMQREGTDIITPHPLEAARLLNCTLAEVQHDRLHAARQLSERYHCVAILKGAGSIICAPDHRLRINTSGNPGLASGGSGDVLAGLCGALLAQHMPAFDAACLAVSLHGLAADDLVAAGAGPVGLTAGELAPAIRLRLNQHAAWKAAEA